LIQENRVGVHITLGEEQYLSLKHFAHLNGEPVIALMRRLLTQALETETGDTDRLTLLVRKAVTDNVKPTENELAKLAANTAMAVAAGMYMGVQCVADLGAKEVVEMHKRAEILARKHWRNPDNGAL